jgi:rare lipoprotein A
MRSSWGALFVGILAFAGCQTQAPPPPALVGHVHYDLGKPWQGYGHWFYPEESYALDTTGIASVLPDRAGLTADGEVYDATALTAAMQTIQLPAIATVTDLENGRQIQVRVNDRGPPDPGRVIALSARAAWLLEMPLTGARVHVQIDTLLSHRLVEQIGGGPAIEVATAPRNAVSAEALPPPGSSAPAGPVSTIGRAARQDAGPAVPDRLPETVRGVAPNPGQLWLRAGVFGRFDYANRLAARLGGLGGTVLRIREGRDETYAVRAGPFSTIAQADAALRRALGANVTDARITVE